VFGIVGALIASYYLGEFTMPRFAISGRLRTVVIFAIYSSLFGRVAGGVDNAAHIGGLVTGLLFGALIARVAPASGGLRRAGVIVLVALIVAGCGAWLYQSRSYLAHVSRAEEFLYEHKTVQGVAELQEVIRQRPNYLPAHAELAHQYLNQKKYDLAEPELQLILKAQPQSEEARYELGIVYLNTQRFGAAKDLFMQMVKADNQDGYAHFGLARALAAEQNYADAVEEYKQAAQLEPDLETVNYRLGLAQIQMKNYDEAIAAFGQQQKIRGDDVDTEMALAEAYRAKGMPAEADAARKRAEELKGKQ
jgi:tetratricopeptide (TPR) repeat protein